ncbi:MAG: GLUG motif-containing protein, partial [Planctomycetota bacterium]
MSRVVARCVCVFLTVVITCGISWAKYSGGTGELDDPYLIATPNDLNTIGTEPNDWDKHFKMIADINLSGFTGTEFNIIGSSTPYFSGIFDGNGFSIIEFTYDSNDEDNVGLFGVIDSTQAVVQDLLLVNPSVTVNSGMFSDGGALVGLLISGSIMRCKISGGQVTGYNYPGGLGGLVGFMDNGLIKDCNVTCVVTGKTSVGGIIGENSGQIVGCHFDGDVSGRANIGGIAGENDDYIAMCSSSGIVTIVYSTGTRHNAGGLVGENRATVCFSQSSATVTGGPEMGGLVGSNYFASVYESSATGTVSGNNGLGGLVGYNHYSVVTNCYAVGSVEGDRAVGGLIGTNRRGNTTHLIKHCYSAGHVSGNEYVGGLIGYDDSSLGDFEKCFWDQTINPSLGGIGNSTDPDVIGRTTFNMKLRATYESAGWNFVTPIWAINDAVEYPKLWWQVFASGYGGGSGTPQDPYLILTAEQLNTIARDLVNLDKHFKLMANIDLSVYTGDQFNTIGDYYNPFTGGFDGNGHTIFNFTYITTLAGDVGLFGYISGEDSEIKNLTLLNPEVRTSEPIGWGTGAIAGDFNHGRMENCHVIGGSVHGNSSVGGLVGSCNADMFECSSSCSVSGDASVGGLAGGCSSKIVSLCHATGYVSGNYRVGGLFGDNYASSMYECWANTNVSGTRQIGGLIGENRATVVNCYSKGQATASIEEVGGFIGINYGQVRNCYSFCNVSGGEDATGGFCGKNSRTIENCYSAGAVTGDGSNVRGFLGRGATSYYCFWDVETSGQPDDGSEFKGIGKTTEQMQSLQTYLPWSCDPVWTIDDGNDYPRLIWENIPGRFIQKPNYGGGSGTQNDPYRIYDTEQLSLIALIPCDLDKHFKLMADIDMITIPPNEYIPIGNDIQPFQGVFDGNNHTIFNFSLKIDESSKYEGFGLFGEVDSPDSHIKNLKMQNSTINVVGEKAWTGALVGRVITGQITNCIIQDCNVSYSAGAVYAGCPTGGLVGSFNSGSITNCRVNCTVSGFYDSGCLAGYVVGTLSECSARGSVSGRGNVGILVGRASSIISNCSAIGNVYAAGENVGGLAGYLQGSCSDSLADCNVSSTGDSVGGFIGDNRATVFNCYSKGTVSGGNNVGGFIGENLGDINDCQSEASVFGSEYVGGLVGNNGNSVVQSYAEAVVDGYRWVGGLLGYNQSQVSLCYANSTVHGYGDVGGFVGGNFAYTYTSLENCYAASDVTGTEKVGGFVGHNDNFIAYCYSMGLVSAPNEVGGFAGDNSGCILACYWDTQTSGLTNSSGGVGKTTAQMKQSSTYLDWESQKVWTIDTGMDYPRLFWESKPGIEIIHQKYFDGQGSSQSPYLISNAGQLNTIGLVPSTWNKHFVLTADIDLSGIMDDQYNVVGKNLLPFKGTFDGQGHRILNFNYRHPSEEQVGIFGCVNDSNALIQDITMINVDINDPAGCQIAPLVGYLTNGTVRNCHVRNAKVSGGSITGGSIGLEGSIVGGLIGDIEGIVIDCSSQAQVSGFRLIGGFTGSVYGNGHVFRCRSISDVAAYLTGGGFVGANGGVIEQSSVEGIVNGYMWIGGFTGELHHDGSILNCYANISTTGEERIGGLVGYVQSPYNISCSYSCGSVSGDEEIGGLVGYGGYSANSFWDVNTSGVDISSGGIGLTTEQMQSLNTYLNAGWDFNDVWTICDGTGYPKFEWEILEADYLCPDGVDFVDYAFLADHWLQTEYGDVNGIE